VKVDSETLIAWAYEQLDKHDARVKDATLLRQTYWHGYKEALECMLLTAFDDGMLTHTRHEINEFIDKHRP